MPWLTVVMPVHSGEQWLEESLLSLVEQADPGLEVIVLDSSLTPATAEIAERFAARLPLRLIRRPDLVGWHEKTNLGVELAQADHVCMLHQDDVWLPGRAAAVRTWLRRAPDAVLHVAPTALLDRSGRRLGLWRCPLPSGAPVPSAVLLERLLVQNFIAVPSPVFRRDAWLAAGGMDTELWYTSDWDIWLKLAETGPVYYHDVVTAGFRLHGGSLTMSGSRKPAELEAQMQTVLNRHVERLSRAKRDRIERAARASISVNVALAGASAGNFRTIAKAAAKLLRLGPLGIGRYVRDSRIVERLCPRVRARLAGAL